MGKVSDLVRRQAEFGGLDFGPVPLGGAENRMLLDWRESARQASLRTFGDFLGCTVYSGASLDPLRSLPKSFWGGKRRRLVLVSSSSVGAITGDTLWAVSDFCIDIGAVSISIPVQYWG